MMRQPDGDSKRACGRQTIACLPFSSLNDYSISKRQGLDCEEHGQGHPPTSLSCRSGKFSRTPWCDGRCCECSDLLNWQRCQLHHQRTERYGRETLGQSHPYWYPFKQENGRRKWKEETAFPGLLNKNIGYAYISMLSVSGFWFRLCRCSGKKSTASEATATPSFVAADVLSRWWPVTPRSIWSLKSG